MVGPAATLVPHFFIFYYNKLSAHFQQYSSVWSNVCFPEYDIMSSKVKEILYERI